MTPRLRTLIGILLGLSLGIVPELGTLGLAILGFVGVVLRVVNLGFWTWFFLFYGVVRGVLYWRTQEMPLMGFLEAMLSYLLCCGALWLQPLHQLSFKRAILIGGFFTATTVLVSLYPGFVIPKQWILNGDQRTQAMLQHNDSTDTLIPISIDNAFVFREFGQQGSGRVRFTLEARSTQSINLRIALLHRDFPPAPIGKSIICEVRVIWSSCSIEIFLKTRADLVLLIGGYNTWKASNGKLEIRHCYLELLSLPTWQEWVRSLPRVQAWTFNPNAFGTWMALIVMVASLSSRRLWEWALLIPIVTGVILSGSRGALVAAVIGIFFGLWYIFPVKYKVIFYVIIGISLGSFIFFNSVEDTSLRALRILTDDGSNTSRLEVYQLSFRAFLESPLIGVGDLIPILRVYKTDLDEMILHAHNIFLQTLGESGLVGLIALLGLWIPGISLRFKQKDHLAIILLFCVILLNQSDYLYWYAPMQLVLWIGFSGFPTNRLHPNKNNLADPGKDRL
jgi:O-Antigen ligase